MMEAGWSARQVARQLGSSYCVEKKCWDQKIREMSFTRKPGSGHPRQTSHQEDHHIVRNARVQPTASFAAIQAHDESRFNLSSDDNRVRVNPVMNASILPLLYSETPLPQLVCWYRVPLPTIHGQPWY
ncbi:transposable element Tcb2 transposase [Trichonephila clavipes]|nr:transposable element Tcb2 transposase [Trichonephila clavipes]